MTTIHIYAPAATAKHIRSGRCPDCKKRTRFLTFFTPWYGADSTCIKCGRTWEDGRWTSLPFYRNARRDSIEHAKKTWRSMPPVSQNHLGLEIT